MNLTGFLEALNEAGKMLQTIEFDHEKQVITGSPQAIKAFKESDTYSKALEAGYIVKEFNHPEIKIPNKYVEERKENHRAKHQEDEWTMSFNTANETITIHDDIFKGIQNIMATVNNCTAMEAVIFLQEEAFDMVNPQTSPVPAIRTFASMPYKRRMQLITMLHNGYFLCSDKQLEEGSPEVSIAELVNLVEQWAKDKNLDTAPPEKQMLKVIEELGEVGAGMARNKRDDIIDGIGDVVVTLIILAMQHDLTLEECLHVAYNEIKDRTGKTEGGVFIKEDGNAN